MNVGSQCDLGYGQQLITPFHIVALVQHAGLHLLVYIVELT